MIKKHTSFINIKTKTGYTVVELIVVVAVIGILATISTISYNSWKQSATTAILKSDTNGVASAMENYRTFNNAYPSSIPSNFAASDGVTLSGGSFDGGRTYCVNAVSAQFPGLYFHIDSTSQTAQPGMCSAINVTAIAAISGSTSVGSVLRPGAITPSSATVSYQWQSATSLAGSYSNISGATASAYTLTVSDVSHYIRVVATGTGSYAGSVNSAPTVTAVINSSDWYPGIAGTILQNKLIYYKDLPQGTPSDPYNVSYPPFLPWSTAVSTCVAIGARLPNINEMQALVDGRTSYGNNFFDSTGTDTYWSSTEVDANTAWRLIIWIDNSGNFGGTSTDTIGKAFNMDVVRCIKD